MNKIGFLQNKQQNQTQTPIVPVEFRHSICYGETGSGKTTGFIYPNIKYRIEQNHGLLVFDFKGKEHLAVKKLAEKEGRLNDIVEIGKPYSAKINILENMTENDFEKFLWSLMKTADWWEQSAVSLCISVFKIIKLFNQIQSQFDNNNIEFLWVTEVTFNSRKGVYEEFGSEEKIGVYSTDISFVNLHNIFKNLENFIVWLEGLEGLLSKMHKAINQNFFKINKFKFNNGFEVVNTYYKIKKEVEDISSFKALTYRPTADKKNSGNHGVLLTLHNIFKNYANKDYLNNVTENRVSISKLLNKSKIVILNTQSFTKSLINILTENLFNDLIQRINIKEKSPISVFIDECQRVLNPDFELPVDILREAKIDVFLSTQSVFLLVKKIGENNFLALNTNITKKYDFRCGDTPYDYLEDHQYSYKDIESFSSPIFIEDKILTECELLFQKQTKIQEIYKLSKNEIIDYDLKLFEKENKYRIIDIKTNSERFIKTVAENKKEQYNLIQKFLAENNEEKKEKEKEFDFEDFVLDLGEDYS